jgi:hypothetical protein
MTRRNMQTAADSAALAGALSRIRDGGTGWVDVAFGVVANNGFENNEADKIVRVYSPPITGPYVGNIEYIQVTIDVITQARFAQVIGVPTFNSHVEAVSRTTLPVSDELLRGQAVVSLAPTSNCGNNRAFEVSGQATLEVYNGSVFVNSNNPSCALTAYGNGSIRIIDPGFTIAVVGGAAIQKPQLFTPYPPATKSVPISYPPPFILPKLSCNKPATISETDPTTISAGYWDGDFPPEDVTSMQPGLYCINDDFIVGGNKTLEGSGVTIFLEHGKFQIANSATVILESTLTGDHAGLLLYAPQDNENDIVLNGEGGSHYRGTILSLGGLIHLKGGQLYNSQIIGYRILADGDKKFVIKYLDEQNYNSIGMPQVQLIK